MYMIADQGFDCDEGSAACVSANSASKEGQDEAKWFSNAKGLT